MESYSKYIIKSTIDRRIIVYGCDSEGGTVPGYYIKVTDFETGKTSPQRGYSEADPISGKEMITILNEFSSYMIPEDREVMEKHKIACANNLPF